jgi:hypothetical protein
MGTVLGERKIFRLEDIVRDRNYLLRRNVAQFGESLRGQGFAVPI